MGEIAAGSAWFHISYTHTHTAAALPGIAPCVGDVAAGVALPQVLHSSEGSCRHAPVILVCRLTPASLHNQATQPRSVQGQGRWALGDTAVYCAQGQGRWALADAPGATMYHHHHHHHHHHPLLAGYQVTRTTSSAWFLFCFSEGMNGLLLKLKKLSPRLK